VRLRDASGAVMEVQAAGSVAMADLLDKYRQRNPDKSAARLGIKFDGDWQAEAVTLSECGIEDSDMLDVEIKK
jgi:hypothetical protein